MWDSAIWLRLNACPQMRTGAINRRKQRKRRRMRRNNYERSLLSPFPLVHVSVRLQPAVSVRLASEARWEQTAHAGEFALVVERGAPGVDVVVDTLPDTELAP